MPDLSTLFSPSEFIPHGHCYLWQPTLVWLHVVSDSLTALAYYSIPVCLVYFAQQRTDLPFRWVFWLFSAFIVACGTTHLLDVWTLWYPTYWVSGMVKLLTALLSIATAVMLYRLLPAALAMPSLAQWEDANMRLREVQRLVRLGHWEYDLQSQLVTWSEELFRLFGLEPAPVAPSYETVLQLFAPASRAQLAQAVQVASTDGTPYTLELQSTRLDRTGHWFAARGEAVRDTTGAIVKLVGTVLDITERKEWETKLWTLNQLKDDFLSTVSHELRTPLASIKLSAHMLAVSLTQSQPSLANVFGDAFASKVSRYMTILQTECEREVNLVNELLELQRLESGAVLPEWHALQLAPWLPELVSAFAERAASRDLTLGLKSAENLPTLVSDATLLTSVLRELLTNACKYTPPGGTIMVSVTPTDTHLQLAVKNSGTTIPPELLPNLFDKFYRLPEGDQWQQGGTGLGLALAKGQVERLGGTLSVTSDDTATVFLVTLPLEP